MFLVSPMASDITGVDLLVDGGTNAINGANQHVRAHYGWNADTAPRVAGGFAGLVPNPPRFDAGQIADPVCTNRCRRRPPRSPKPLAAYAVITRS